jgi:acyltransferase
LQLSDTLNLRPARHPALDGARGLAVVAMVLGHTLDAVLSPEVRANTWVQGYWSWRGITAPLFLLVSGWAVVAALDHRQDAARTTYGRRIGRGLLLILLGYVLHWPGWETVRELGWGDALLGRLFGFDALQCIGISLLVGATVLRLAPGSRSRAAALAALAVGIPLASPALWRLGTHLPVMLQQAVGVNGSHFPLFPWAGYFFAGALIAYALRLLRPGLPQALVLTVLGGGLYWFMHQVKADWSENSAWLVAYRVGEGMLVLAVVSCAPVRLLGLLAPVGRLSLWVYVLHIPVVYGWGGTPGLIERVGPTLGLGQGLLVGVSLLSGSYAIARFGSWLRGLNKDPWRGVGSPSFGTTLGGGQRSLS